MKPVGEPDALNGHVRFDERRWETGRCQMAQATAPIFDSTVLFGECRHGRFSRSPIRRQPNFAQVFMRVGLHRLRKLVENVQCLVQPTALMPGRRKRLVEGFPKSERAIANGDLRSDQQAARRMHSANTPGAAGRDLRPLLTFLLAGAPSSSTGVIRRCALPDGRVARRGLARAMPEDRHRSFYRSR